MFKEDKFWCTTATQLIEQLAITSECVQIDVDIIPSDLKMFRKAFGTKATDVSLIHPDDYIVNLIMDEKKCYT